MVKKILKKKRISKRKGGDITKLREILEDINNQINEVNESNDADKELQLFELEENKKEIEKELEELYNAQEKDSINDYRMIDEYLKHLDEIDGEIAKETNNINKSRLIESRANIIESLKKLGHDYEPSPLQEEYQSSLPPPAYEPPPAYQPPPQQVYKFIPPLQEKTNYDNLIYSISEFKKISDLISDTNFRHSIELYKNIFLINNIDMKTVDVLIRSNTMSLNNDGSTQDRTLIPIREAMRILSQMDMHFMELLKIMDYIINTLKYDSYDKLSKNNIPNILISYLGCRIHDFKYILYENKVFNKTNKQKGADAFVKLLVDIDKQISFEDDRKTRRDSTCGRLNIDYFNGGKKNKGGVRKLKSYA